MRRGPVTSEVNPIDSVIGRDLELAAGDRLLAGLATRSSSLMLEGEPGIGKTTLWEAICARARDRGYTVLESRPVASETELAFAGLMDLVGEHADKVLPELPAPQRHALEVALLRVESGARTGGLLATSAAFMSVVGKLARSSTVLIAIDDLQWLDPPTMRVLRFAARRLGPHRAGILATVRIASPLDPSVSPVDLGVDVERMRLHGMPVGGLYHVIDVRLGIALPRATLVRIEATSAGNPFLALELARAVAGREPVRAFEWPSIRIQTLELMSARIRNLPGTAQNALLRAAAMARPTTALVDMAALGPAVADGLVEIEIDGRVRFVHPLFAHAVYGGATPLQRASVHAALAGEVQDPDERARHAALGSQKRDEDIARQLFESAERLRARGAPELAAELAERSAERTPSSFEDLVLDRRLRAAEHLERAGDVARAAAIANEILELENQDTTRSRALQLLAEIAYGENFAEAETCLEEALLFADHDPMRRAQLELNLAFTGIAMSDLGRSLSHAQLAESLAARLGDRGLQAEATGIRVFSETLLTDRLDRQALSRSLMYEDHAREAPIQIRPSQNAGILDMLFGRLEDARRIFLDLRQRVLESGEEHELPFVLNLLGFIELFRGDMTAARAHVADAERTSNAIGSKTLNAYARAIGAIADSFAGADEGVLSDANAALSVFEQSGWRTGSIYALKAIAFHALSRGDWSLVLETLSPISAVLGNGWGFCGASFIAGDLVEALLAEGELETAARLVEGAIAGGLAADSPWALVVGFRGRALLESARGHRETAMAAIARAEAECARMAIPFELGRTHLARGQILRRLRQKRSALDSLRAARTIFEGLSMPLWVERADAEIGRIGLRKASPASLTDSEHAVATLAASGLTNREIAARAFLSPRSVEDVLSRVYAKLGIRSRAELGAWMARR